MHAINTEANNGNGLFVLMRPSSLSCSSAHCLGFTSVVGALQRSCAHVLHALQQV